MEGTGLISDEFYQPTNHALVAIQAGGQSALTTEWRRSGSSDGFSVVLNPGKYEAFGLNPGRYMLVAAKADGDNFDFGGADGTGEPVLSVEPGEVVDAGILMLRKNGERAVVQISDNPTAARAAIQARYPLQAQAMKSKPLEVTQ